MIFPTLGVFAELSSTSASAVVVPPLKSIRQYDPLAPVAVMPETYFALVISPLPLM
jgi:hypothetical protein